MKGIRYSLIAVVLTAVVIVITAGCVGPVEDVKQLQSATENLQMIIQSKLLNLNNAVSGAAEKIAKSGLQGEETRGILNGLCKKYPYLLDCSVSDPLGKLVTVAPEGYRRYEGTDTAATDTAKKFFVGLSENRTPVLSDIFRAVEGPDAVALVWPVVTEKGELLGFISALFKPGDLLEKTIAPAAETRVIKVNVMQLDGMVIYCSTGTETGKNVLTDPSYKGYPELIAQAEKIAAQKTGTGSYMYPDAATGKPVKKTVYWTTVGLNGTEWRLISIAELGD